MTPSLQPGASGAWITVPAFPALSFAEPGYAFEPVFLTGAPRSDQLYVCDKKGKIWNFTNDPDTATKSEFLDLSAQIKITPNAGLGGLAFHPDFGLPGSPNRGYLYLHYFWSPSPAQLGPANQVPDSADELPNPGFWRLSRFTVQDGQADRRPQHPSSSSSSSSTPTTGTTVARSSSTTTAFSTSAPETSAVTRTPTTLARL